MKLLVGISLLLAAVALAGFVGIYLMFVGGIFQIVHGASTTPVDTGDVVWGALRIVFASPAATIAGWLLALPGIGFIASALK